MLISKADSEPQQLADFFQPGKVIRQQFTKEPVGKVRQKEMGHRNFGGTLENYCWIKAG